MQSRDELVAEYGEQEVARVEALYEAPDLAGKTIKATTTAAVEGAFGLEPAIVLSFSDGTEHAFVLPSGEVGW